MALGRNIGMLSGDPRGALDPNMYYQRGQALGQQMGQSLGMLAGRDMRTGEQVAAAEQNKYLQAAADRSKKSDELFLLSQQAINAGYPEVGGQLLKVAEDRLALEKANTARRSLSQRLKDVGLEDMAQYVLDGGDTADAIKALKEKELIRVQGKADRPTRARIARRYGNEDLAKKVEQGEYDGVSKEAWAAELTGLKAELKTYQDESGKVRPFRTNDGGFVWDEDANGGQGGWVTPETLGLEAAPQMQKVYNVGNELTKALVGKTVDNLAKFTEDADKAQQTLASIQKSKNLISGGVNTGVLANFKTGAGKVAALLGLPADDSKRTEQLVINQLEFMSNLIRDYGSGTGISNFDVQNVMQRIGADPTSFEETITDILGRMESLANHMIAKHGTVMAALKQAEGVDASLVDAFSLTPFTPAPASPLEQGGDRRSQLRAKHGL